jgi:hypothetical protein
MARSGGTPDRPRASAYAVNPDGFKTPLRISPCGTGRIPFFFILLFLDNTRGSEATTTNVKERRFRSRKKFLGASVLASGETSVRLSYCTIA